MLTVVFSLQYREITLIVVIINLGEANLLHIFFLVPLRDFNITTTWLQLLFLYLPHELPVGSEAEAQWLWVILQDILDAVVKLCVHHLHVVQDYLLACQHLVEWPHKEC